MCTFPTAGSIAHQNILNLSDRTPTSISQQRDTYLMNRVSLLRCDVTRSLTSHRSGDTASPVNTRCLIITNGVPFRRAYIPSVATSINHAQYGVTNYITNLSSLISNFAPDVLFLIFQRDDYTARNTPRIPAPVF